MCFPGILSRFFCLYHYGKLNNQFGDWTRLFWCCFFIAHNSANILQIQDNQPSSAASHNVMCWYLTARYIFYINGKYYIIGISNVKIINILIQMWLNSEYMMWSKLNSFITFQNILITNYILFIILCDHFMWSSWKFNEVKH